MSNPVKNKPKPAAQTQVKPSILTQKPKPVTQIPTPVVQPSKPRPERDIHEGTKAFIGSAIVAAGIGYSMLT